jgi:hypothetical protein
LPSVRAPPTGAWWRACGLYSRARFGFHADGSDAAPESAFTMADVDTAAPIFRRPRATAGRRAPMTLPPALSGRVLRLISP